MHLGMIALPKSMGKLLGRLISLAMVRQSIKEKEKIALKLTLCQRLVDRF